MATTAGSVHGVTIDFVTVGDPGNAADPRIMDDGTTGYGSVAAVYQIARFEISNSAYAELLNAAAAADPNGLYDARMGTDASFGGITRSGASGSFTYAVKSGFANKPVVYVSFWNALRFANWLDNGQPSGAQGPTTTEGGSYTITAGGIANNSIVRNPGGGIVVPSEDEWYKAAYYDTATMSYFEYPTSTDVSPICSAPAGDTGNSANCFLAVNLLTDAGAYPLSSSFNGTLDQGGNVWEWNEETAFTVSGRRGIRGGAWNTSPAILGASTRASGVPGSAGNTTGFRVASVPEPRAVWVGIFVAWALAQLRRRRN